MQMKQPNSIKFCTVKYFFLAFGLLQILVGTLMWLRFQDTARNRFAILVFVTLGMIFFFVQMVVFSKLKRVAISKKKISIVFIHRTKHYDWEDVRKLKLNNFLNMYSLKLKGHKMIYFLADTDAPLFGLFSKVPECFPRKMH